MFTPKHLKKWEKVSDYGGEDLSEWYILLAQTRDSFLLDRTNFRDVKEYLISQGFEIAGDLDDCKADGYILLASFGHWACGWIESLMIHESNDKALELADEIARKLDEYPIWNDESYSQAENDLQWEYVRQYAVIDWLRDNDIEYTDKMADYLTSEILNTYDCEVNGYDEVILPADLDLSHMVERYQHLTLCQACGDEIDNRSESCSCQMRMKI